MTHTQTSGRPTTQAQSFLLAGEESPCWYTARSGVGSYDPGEAERLLRSSQSAAGPDHFRAARVLLHDGRPHQVALWCIELRNRARTAAWATAFGALRSESLFHLGDLPAAEYEAAEARGDAGRQPAPLSPWTTALLTESLIEQGRHEEAAACLGEPADHPDLSGLPPLRAHGRLLLALGRPDDALTAFTRVALLVRRHTTELLPHLPWRSDLAQALLRLGRRDQAHALLMEELASPAPGPRERGIALRLLSATEEPERRLPTLSRAATELRRSDERMELARVLNDFAHTLDTLGELSTAEVFRRRAAGLLAA
ncbi:tol-pal system YbgF family protein [Streptomyces sp. NPDC057074]|uniref:tetratricopeptide repeat protein n=1 Tax=Streptomyces sp. NPDC057074 TaxID=3346015 RepID=UPI00362AC4D1